MSRLTILSDSLNHHDKNWVRSGDASLYHFTMNFSVPIVFVSWGLFVLLCIVSSSWMKPVNCICVMEFQADFGLKFHNPLSPSILVEPKHTVLTAYTWEYSFIEVDYHYLADNLPWLAFSMCLPGIYSVLHVWAHQSNHVLRHYDLGVLPLNCYSSIGKAQDKNIMLHRLAKQYYRISHAAIKKKKSWF